MPTLLVLDVSYSMGRIVSSPNNSSEQQTLLQLAIQGINSFLDYLTIHSKLEFVALVTFSSLYDVVCSFTRDYSLIREKIQRLEEFDKTCIENAYKGINSVVTAEWGNNSPCQVILITDGCIGQDYIIDPSTRKSQLFEFPGKLHVVCISKNDDQMFVEARPLYQQLLEMSGPLPGSLYYPEFSLDVSSVRTIFKKLAEDNYREFKATLRCGKLENKVLVSPPPETHVEVTEYETTRHNITNIIEICGFISVQDIGSPMAISRHLLLPAPVNLSTINDEGVIKSTADNASKMDDSHSDDDSTDEGKIPSLCVILHGALKVENMAALVLLGDNWYGFVYSWADNRKKSNLMLMILEPGHNVLPWLGDLRSLGTIDMATSEDTPVFPVRPSEKRSYSQSSVTWIKHAGLQSDIQKILRHARKLPDKTSHFYKELNRIRRAAISLGFLELLDGLACIFERECTLLPANANPDCALQLSYAANELKKLNNRDISINVNVLSTKFNSYFPTGQP